jgi:heme oxygenase
MLRDLLRSETQKHHERIERSLGIPESIQTKNEYVRLIQRFYDFYVGVEQQQLRFVDELGALGLDLRVRMKSRLLLDDLAAFGGERESTVEHSICLRLPRILSLSEMFGSLYVLEGSTLGGQVISRHFRETLKITPDKGGSFFFGYGAETGKMWQHFLAHLNSHGERFPERQSQAVRAACETFECLEEWLILPHAG